MLKEKIGVIGAGKIGSAIARGVIRAGLANMEDVMASDVSDALRQSIAQELGIKVTPDNSELCDFADIVILAVKPQIVDPVAKEIAKKIGKAKLVVSVAAGVPLARIESQLAHGARVVRVMPNIPCVVGAGAAGFAGGSHAIAEDLEKVGAILNSFGIGLPVEAVYGAARMALESNKHLGELKDEVTSPGGTTIAGLYAMEQKGFRGTVIDAVVSATKRSQELGKG